jgi:hypothetical protein
MRDWFPGGIYPCSMRCGGFTGPLLLNGEMKNAEGAGRPSRALGYFIWY